MTTFALVHGAWHGGWVWASLTAELERRGHRAVAPDLPGDDVAATFDDYAGVVVAALGDPGDDVVVVGHSLGGLTIPVVAARRPVRALVHLCALVAQPGRSLVEQLDEEPEIFVAGFERGLTRDEQRRRCWADQAVARASLYPDCAADVAAAAFARLRPQSTTPYRAPCSLEAWPDVPVASILCTEDRIVDPAWSRRAAGARLGIEAVEIAGGHSPMLARPGRLAGLLTAVV